MKFHYILPHKSGKFALRHTPGVFAYCFWIFNPCMPTFNVVIKQHKTEDAEERIGTRTGSITAYSYSLIRHDSEKI